MISGGQTSGFPSETPGDKHAFSTALGCMHARVYKCIRSHAISMAVVATARVEPPVGPYAPSPIAREPTAACDRPVGPSGGAMAGDGARA